MAADGTGASFEMAREDRAYDALDMLDFVVAVLAVTEPFGNQHADSGIYRVAERATDTLREVVESYHRECWQGKPRHDGDVTIIEGSELLRT